MKRVIVMGGPGSGKSTLARELGAALDIPVYHLDRYFWNPGWVQTPWVDFADRVGEIAELDEWVIDGNYSFTLPDRLARADTVVYLDLPLRVRLPRVLIRRVRFHGRTRDDMGPGCPERIDWTFLKQVMRYTPDRHLQALNTLHELRRDEVPLHVLRSGADADCFLTRIRDGRVRPAMSRR